MNKRQIKYLNTPQRATDLGYVISLWSDGKVRVTNLQTGNIVRTFRAHNDAVLYLTDTIK